MVVATLLPLVGPVVALPADATVDWLLIGAVAYALLGLFPAHLVREHHARIFHPRRTRRCGYDSQSAGGLSYVYT